jgi:plasmid maintenance system antidote protein VapI
MTRQTPANRKPKTLTDQLRHAIEASGLSTNKLAVESGVPQPVLHRFMASEQGLTLETADKLAAYLGLNLKK